MIIIICNQIFFDLFAISGYSFVTKYEKSTDENPSSQKNAITHKLVEARNILGLQNTDLTICPSYRPDLGPSEVLSQFKNELREQH